MFAARAILPLLALLLGDEADDVRHELQDLLRRAEADERVHNQIRALLVAREVTRTWTVGYLRNAARTRAKGSGGDPLIRRTPHLDAPERLRTTKGAGFEIEIWTDAAPARAGEESEGIVIEAPPEIRVIELGVLVITSPHLVVEEPYFQPLKIVRDEESSKRITFQVTVSGDDAPGQATLTAQFHYRGRPCGRVRRSWSWPAGSALPAKDSSAGLPVPTDVQDPDLTVLITDTGAGRFTCSIRDPAVSPEFTRPVEWEGVRGSAEILVTDKLAKLVDRGREVKKRQLALLTAGRAFWNAAPKPFQEALWRLIARRYMSGAEGRAAIYIASDEPLLPWEIMLPSRQVPGGPVEDRPQALGVEFAVGRWVRGDATSPPQTLPVSNSLLIAAHYEDADYALDPATERAVLEQRFNCRQLEHVTWEYFEEHLEDNAASLLHFVCHGAADSGDSTLFFDELEEWTSAELRENAGLKAACGKVTPIVFLNACDGARQSSGLGPGGSGFPRMFSDLGARAIVAPLWPVTKWNAPLVAKEIYEQADANPERPLADVLADLRARSYVNQPFDDSWAAYSLFGDPRGKIRQT